MSYSDVMRLAAGLLQLMVAVYSLMLIRRFRVARVGWSVFSSFALLVLLHCLFAMEPFRGRVEAGFQLELVYSVAAVLLLISLVHLETLLLERGRAEAMVRDQTAELTRANEALRETAANLQAEMAERKRVQQSVDKTHRELLTASRQAGMSEVATAVLHNVGNVLNSVNVSASLVAEHLADLKIASVARVAGLMRDNSENLAEFLTQDPRGRQLPGFLTDLARHLSSEQSDLLQKVDFVRKKIDHIKEIVATQQSYGKVCAITENFRMTELVEDVLHIHASELTENGVQLQREYESPAPEIIVDKHKVLQILLNLISNARYACLESGRPDKRVTVRVTHRDNRVQVLMTDNGIGIPAENLEKIFNHGFTTKKKGGHGFGLHSGALAAKELGGSLSATSDGPGLGATFILELPLAPKGVNPGRASLGAAARGLPR
jgi:C4-dicarboxylate-specific signal transduction histidine kinase